MGSTSAFTEEGRTRIRNFQRRVSSYLIVWILVGAAATAGCIYLRTSYGYRPLQRLYLSQYIRASIKSFLPLKRPSRYTLLVRVVRDEATGKELIFGCTDDQVTPIRDETGRVKFDPRLGPFFTLQPGIPHKYFYWRSLPQMDKEMCLWLRDQIYDGRSLIGLYWLCFLPLPLIVALGMFASIKFDLRMNRDYEAGDLLRGVRILKPQEYAREVKRQKAGIGIPALQPERNEL
ncbi:MAG TPA: hypothetical protein VJT15_24900 [Pyrinomonadaceae bacterium]|nr:hypothetical protein [Pyrinomonadaceae bacterium]